MHDAETVLFVDDDQAQVFELDVFLQQPVRADDDVDPALGGLLQHLGDLFGGQKTADHFDAHRMIAEAMAKSLQVLLRQDRRRRQHGDLLAALDREKRGAHRDFGLAVTDIAANQAVHRFFPLHARQGFVDGALLIGRLFEFESRFELLVHVVRRRRTRCPRALRAGRKVGPVLPPSRAPICAPWL